MSCRAVFRVDHLGSAADNSGRAVLRRHFFLWAHRYTPHPNQNQNSSMSAINTVFLPGPIYKSLVADDDITFFRSKMHRHTPFQCESLRVNFDSDSVSGGKICRATLSRSGDCITDLFLRVELPAQANDDLGAAVNYVASNVYEMIDYVSISVGNQELDRLYGDFMWAWSELCESESTKQYSVDIAANNKAQTLICHLPFYFSRSFGTAQCLKIVAMQYHAVKVAVKWRAQAKLDALTNAAALSATASLQAEYVYLNMAERTKIANSALTEIVTEVQRATAYGLSGSASVDIPFNHAVKELVIVTKPAGDYLGSSGLARFGKVDLLLNNQSRFQDESIDAFFCHHGFRRSHSGSRADANGIAIVPFCLEPEKSMPTGHLNFSRIDSAKLKMENVTANTDVCVYARSINLLRVQNGLAGLAFSS